MKKQILLCAFLLLFIGNLFSQGSTCSNATPFCTDVGTPFTYPNIYGQAAPTLTGSGSPSVSPFYGCLCNAWLKNPNWFYIKSTAAGAMTYTISQTNGDVDFIAWGPFTNSVTMCSNLVGTCGAYNCDVSHPTTCGSGIVDCSGSIAAVETMTLNPTAAGQYFMILITNYQGSSGNITITQGSGPSSDCSITCPPNTFTMVGSLASNGNIQNSGSTVNCTQPFYIRPPDLTPAGASYNPYKDELTPCLGINFDPYVANLDTRGTVNIFQNGTQTGTLCPTCPNSIGDGGTAPGANLTWYVGYNNPTLPHSYQFCNTAGATGPTTVSIKSCWTPTLTLAGPTVWNTSSASCFTLNVPANTPIGTASYSISPASGGAGLYDSQSGWAYIDPSYIPSGTTYTVTYTFNNGICGNVYGYYVFTVPTTPVVTAITSKTACSGSPVSATNFTTTPTGGSVNWTNNNTAVGVGASGTSNIASYTAPVVTAQTVGVFSVTATQNGCSSAAQIFSITINPLPTPTITSSPTTTLCLGSSLTFTGSGASTYTWAGTTGNGLSGSTGSTIGATPTATGNITYTTNVTSAEGCTNTAVRTITVNPNPTANAGTAPSVLNCTNTAISLSGSGGGTYSWSGPGITSGSNTATPSVNTGGTYSLVVTSTAGCTSTVSTVAVTQNTTAPTAGASNTTTLTCVATTATLTGTGGGTYSWTGPNTITNPTSANPTVSAPGTYTVIVTAANGCTATATAPVTQNTTAPTAGASNTTTLTCVATTATLTGTGGGTYSWTGPSTITNPTSANPTVSAPGTYTVRVTAANGCTATATAPVTQNTTAPTAGASNTTTLTCVATTATLTGTGGGTYSWAGPNTITNPTSANPTVSAPGTYTVRVTAANGCTATATAPVTQNTTSPTPIISTPAQLNCTLTTTSLSGTPASGVTYTWTGPGTITNANTATPTINSPGSYSLTVTNTVNSCTATTNVSVTQNTVVPNLTMPASQTITCSAPTVTLTASASPTTVTPVWTGGVLSGANNLTATASSPNTYTLTVTNPANGCTNSGTVSVSPSAGTPVVLASNTGSITCTNTTAQVSVSTTMTPVSYAWSGPGAVLGAATSNGTVTVGGTYQCVVTNLSSNCSSTITTVVPTNTTPVTPVIAPTGTINCNVTSLTLSVTPTGSYTYNWAATAGLTGNAVSTPTVTQGGVYTVTVTNNVNGCIGSTNVTVASNTIVPTVTVSPNSYTITCASPTVQLTANASIPGVTYSWTASGPGSLNSYTVGSPIANGSGTYTVVVTSTLSGCSDANSQGVVTVIPDAAMPTISVSATSLSITCTNTTVTTAITTTNTISSYNWNPTPLTGGANPVFDTPGTYNATITASNGCAVNASINVSLDNTVPTASLTSAVNGGTITCTNTMVTISPTVTPSSNITYTWIPSGVTSSSINDATFTSAGVYTLVVTNTDNGCVSASTNAANTFTVIADNATPTFTLGTAPSLTTTCANPTATLSASSDADPNSVYTWMTPSSSTLTGNPIQSSIAGIYTVVVTNTVNGCSTGSASQATVEVVADAGIPSGTLSVSSISITCTNPTPSVSVNTTASPVSYSWSPTTGIVPGTETTANPSFNAAGSYSVIITNTSSGCASDITSNVVNVYLNNTQPAVLPFLGATNSGTINCFANSVTADPIIFPGNADLTFTWTPTGTGLSTPQNQASATFTAAGVYTLVVTNTVTGCTSAITATSMYTVVADNTPPTATINAASSNTTIGCGASNATVTLSGAASTSPNSPNYTWLPGGSTNVNLPVTTSGTYTLVVTDAVSGCSNTAQYFVDGNTNPPQGVNAGGSAAIACGNSTVMLNGVSSSTNVSYSWSGPSGTSIVSGANSTTPVVAEAGNYTLTVTDNSNNCTSSAVVVVTQAIATASITANPTTGISPLNVDFTGSGAGNPTYSWNFDDGNTSSSQNPSNTFATGTYVVTLTTTSGSCTATATVQIIVEDGLTLEIPNVFTPNDDTRNDVFTIKSTGVKEISLQIFNRWGEKLYEFSGSNASWDGKAPNGLKVPEGTYFFFVKATGFDGKEIEKQGTVSLFR